MKKFDELQNEVSSDEEKNKSEFKLMNDGYPAVYEELRNIWSELLGEDTIHPEDDFNSLGGESLLAIQMMNMVKKRIGFQLEIADTFGYPSLGALAGFIIAEMHKDTTEDATVHNDSSELLLTYYLAKDAFSLDGHTS